MKPNKSYNGVSNADLERGFTDTMPTIPPSSDPLNNLPAELAESKQGGFLERQNVFERL